MLSLAQTIALHGLLKPGNGCPFIGTAADNSSINIYLERRLKGMKFPVECEIAAISIRPYAFKTDPKQLEDLRDFIQEAIQEKIDRMTMQEFALLNPSTGP